MSLTHTSFILSHNRPYAYTFKTGQRWLCPRSEIGARDHMSYYVDSVQGENKYICPRE